MCRVAVTSLNMHDSKVHGRGESAYQLLLYENVKINDPFPNKVKCSIALCECGTKKGS